MNLILEIIGTIATLFILFSMLFKTTTLRGDIRMRFFNLIGSAIFAVYGILLPAISTAILNGALIFINIYHLCKLIKESKTSNPSENQK